MCQRAILVFIIFSFLLSVYCGIFEFNEKYGSIHIGLITESDSPKLAKVQESLSTVQCIVKMGSNTIHDQSYNKTNDQFNIDIEKLKPSDNYSILLYGKNNDGDIIGRGYKDGIVVKAGEETNVSMAWNKFKPVLSSPANGSTTDDDTPTFDWNDVSNAAAYELIVDNSSSFTNPEININNLTSSDYTVTSSFSENTYFWKVRCKDSQGNWGGWSDTWQLMISKNTVVTPTFNPSPGTYTTSQNVTIACTTSGAVIHYTTNGADPTESDAIYSGSIAISTTTTLKAKAYKNSWHASDIISGSYVILGNRLVGYYPFNGNANDESGSGYNGIAYGATLTSDRFGDPNSAYSFDGDDRIDCGDVYNDITLPFTISAWMYRISGVNSRHIFITDGTLDDSNANYYGLFFKTFTGTEDDQTLLDITYGDGTGHGLDDRRTKRSDLKILPYQWTHVAAVVRGSTEMSLYINGEGAAGEYDGTGGNIIHNSWHAMIGTSFIGMLDEIRIYNYALTDDEILSLYQTDPINVFYLTVSSNPSAGGSISKNPDQDSYTYGQLVTFTASPSAGYEFSHWSGDASGSDVEIDITMTSNKNITANFTQLQVATPIFDPSPGTYDTAQNVTITCSTSGATIYYTTDGSDPTESDAVYSSPVTISSTATLKARAYKTGWGPSEVVSGTYTINSPNTLSDIDGNVYHTVTIGTQEWMVENLKVTHFRNGEPIPNVTDASQWKILSTGAYCNYGNSTANADIYGCLYNWYAVNDSRIIAPEGWHVPSDEDWQTLADYLGGELVAGGKLKETGTSHWYNPNTGATNESGFTALPGGSRYESGIYQDIGLIGNYWSSTQLAGENLAWNRLLDYNKSEVTRFYYYKQGAMSVRCLKGNISGIVSTPFFNPSPGTYNNTQSVSITCSTSGATIYYTTDGSDPKESDAVYNGPITISSTTTLKARAYNSGCIASEIATGIYTITSANTVTDFDGNVYQTVTIGTQEWIVENLKVTHFRNGEPIPNLKSDEDWGHTTSTSTSVYCYYDNDSSFSVIYGHLYNWYTIKDNRNIAPVGWHVPNDSEWQTLIDYLGGTGTAGGKMKEIGITYWRSPNTGATNESGFSVLPGGYRNSGGKFDSIGSRTRFWSSSEYNTDNAWFRGIDFDNIRVDHNFDIKGAGFSVRLLKDN